MLVSLLTVESLLVLLGHTSAACGLCETSDSNFSTHGDTNKLKRPSSVPNCLGHAIDKVAGTVVDVVLVTKAVSLQTAHG